MSGTVPVMVDGEPVEMTDGLRDALAVDASTPPVPASITARQMRLGLLAAGLLDQVEALIPSTSRAVQIEWEYGTTVYRDSPVLAQIAAAPTLGLTEAQVDDLFRAAAAL